jgi:voltage-gated potassium channel
VGERSRLRAPDPDAGALRALIATLAASAIEPGGAPYRSLKEQLRAAVLADPFDATVATVLGGALLFYVAEKGHNPKVKTYWDALVFVSTCLSVGYADVFARTPAGKAIASAVMTLGPAMSGALLDQPAGAEKTKNGEAPEPRLELERAIVEKLDAILGELRAARAPAPGG